MNGIMLVHPYILYTFYCFFIGVVLNIFVNLIFLKFYYIKFIKYNKISLIKNFLIIYLSIILGCLWAEQELSWGG